MLDKQLIEKKLRWIEECLRELELVSINNLEEFKENIITKRFIERNIELAIENMIGICKHFVSGLGLKEPETYSECFEILTKAKIISKEHLNIFKTMVRFRNLLIHVYDNIDDSITYGIYKYKLGDFKLFIEEIRNYLKSN